MISTTCPDCNESTSKRCEKHFNNICPVDGSVCDRTCGYFLHGSIRRKPVVLEKVPAEDIKDGLLVVFEEETETETKYAYTDINIGQTEYELPKDRRTIKGIYMKIR